ncbi:MAG: serpin family protein [Lachnospiraceae bacterium]|nr:serpin family protein [Lachnospiraceae bacterium]
MKHTKKILCICMMMAWAAAMTACGLLTEEKTIATTEAVHTKQETRAGTNGETQSAGSETENGTEDPAESGTAGGNTDVDETFRQAAADFSLRLFAAGMQEEENTLLAPTSVLTALAMATNGADGETRSQMLSVLGDALSLEEWNEALTAWNAGLPDSDTARLSQANSIWFNSADWLTVRQDFLDEMETLYGASLREEDFADASAVERVNAWISENTDGKIEDMIDELDESTAFLLINAMSFDAEWETPYTTEQIGTQTFTGADGTEKDVEMLFSEEYTYLKTEDAVGFVKDYAGGYRFVVLLPDEEISIQDYVAQLTDEQFLEILDNAQTVSVETGMPKFETDYAAELSEILKEMGMTDAFDADLADLSLMGECSDGNLVITRVLHNTTITVDENGTEAGAATAVEVCAETALEETYQVVCDRPYVYAIVEAETNLPLFIGTVMEVEAE